MSYIIQGHKEGTAKEPSLLKKDAKIENFGCKIPIENFGKERIKEKIKEMEESCEKSEISENSSCSCSSKIKTPYNYTLEELEQKRLELIGLQRAVLNLRLISHQQKKSGAKLLKLSLNSKFKFHNPEIKLNFETLTNIKHENELVKSEVQHLLKNNAKQHKNESFSLEEQISLLKNSSESVYKIFVGRLGHLKGENQPVFVVLSCEAFWVVDENSCPMLRHRIAYEDIDTVIVGESERWLSVLERHREDSKPLLQIEFGDPATSRNLLKHFEVVLRRRLITLRGKQGGTPLEPTDVSKRLHHISIGRWLEPLLPSVVSCSSQEARYIEGWLMEQLKTQRRPRVLACWLVFWESGSEFWCEKDVRTDPGPRLEGFLMVSSSPRHNRWTPSYFYLKDGVLHQFSDPHDRLPQFVIRVQEFCGCRRLPSSLRPHSFELLRKGGGASLAFAAANEDAASHWVQSLLRLLGLGHEDRDESRRLRPCQVIQTNDGLVLSHQVGLIDHLCQLSRKALPPPQNPTLNNRSPKHRSPATLPVESKDKFRRSIFSKGKRSLSSPRLSSMVSEHVEDWPVCPPTPPVPDLVVLQPDLDEGSPGDQHMSLLAFCSLEQIAEVFVTTRPSNGCLMEFECSEASEAGGAGGDWVLYFESDKRLAQFLASVLSSREQLTQELMGLTRVSRGSVHDLLTKGAAISKNLWNPPQ